MKRIVLYLFLLYNVTASVQTKAQMPSCTGNRYLQQIYDNTQLLPNKVYTKNDPEFFLGTLGVETVTLQDMVMDIRLPPTSDTLTKRPVMIWGHGGGFLYIWGLDNTVAVGSKNNDDIQAIIDTFARRGFVTASIQYRRGVDPTDLTPASAKRAVWRGAQDMNAAIRYFTVNASKFNIDPNYIFIGGSSAGAFASIHATFIDPNEKFGAANAQYNLLGIEIAPDLGDMDSRPVERITSLSPYQTTTVAGNVNSLPAGVMSCWGAIDNLSHFNGNRQAPTIMFHGLSDVVVFPYCNEPFVGLVTLPEFCGSQEMAPVLNNLNILNEVHLEPGQPHEYWGALNGGWITGQPNAYFNQIIHNISQFVYNIMKPATPIITGNTLVCGNDTLTYTLPIINNGYYCWQVSNGTIINTTANTITIRWDNANELGTIEARHVSQNVVESNLGQLNINITQAPTNMQIQNVTSNSFEVIWDGTSTQAFTLNYRQTGNPLWNTVVVTGNSYTLSNLNACASYELNLVSYCGNNLSTHTLTLTTPTAGIVVPVKVLLQGAYNLATGSMRTYLQNTNNIPIHQPYNLSPWNYNGTEQVANTSSFPNNSVDWILIELRLASNPNAIVEQRAGILTADGIVVEPNGTIGLRFCNIQPNTNYKVVVRHRNHLAVISRGVWNSSSQETYDFTDSPVKTEGGTEQQINIDNHYAMRAGDCNANGIINQTDYNYYKQQIGIGGYNNADCNFNANVNATDFETTQPNFKAIAPLVIRY